MPHVVADVYVPVPPHIAFAVSQTTGTVRLRWDPFIRRQQFLGGAQRPGKGVLTRTQSRLGPQMVSRYVSYTPPRQVGMTMVEGPWFFRTFGGGWRFEAEGTGTRATWKYTFATQPTWLSPIADRIGSWLLGVEIRRRIDGYARGCVDPVVVAAATAQLNTPS